MSRLPTEPTPASAQVEETLARIGVAGAAAALRIRRHWAEIAPAPWRDRARPLILEDGCLVVEVASQMDATLLRYGAASLVEQVNEALGAQVVSRVATKVSRSSGGRQNPRSAWK